MPNIELRKFIILFLSTCLFAETAEMPPKIYSNSKNCKPCHKIQAKDWSTTWHSRSHISKNTLYKKMIEYVANKRNQNIDIIKLECATCHNPRITKTTIKDYIEYNIAKILQLETKESIEVEKALKSKVIKEGINCIVCHNIDKIKESRDIYKRGHQLIIWTKEKGVMTGPFDSDNIAYHKCSKRDFFRKYPNRLCFICHYGGVNYKDLAVYETGIEYENSENAKEESCVECHMSHHTEAYIMKTLKYGRKKILKRKVRSHLFAGVRNSNIVRKALNSSVGIEKNILKVKIKNLLPHKLPTGFGGRELIIEALFSTKNRNITLKRKLGVLYKDNLGDEVIPYLATRVKKDTRLKPYESREFTFSIPKETKSIKVIIYYRLINDFIEKELKIKDKTFTKKYKIIEHNLKF